MLKNTLLSFALIVFTLALFVGVDRAFHHHSPHFSASKATPFHPYAPELEIEPLNAEDQKELDQILAQKFTFLGKGSHTYVFVSEDKKHVVKFLKLDQFGPKSWLSYLPFCFNPHYKEFVQSQEKMRQTLKACHLAFSDFKNETGLIAVHLNRSSNLNKKLSIFDKKGKIQTIDLDKTAFYVQKKAGFIYSRLTELMSKGETEKAKEIISSVFSLLQSLGCKGAYDSNRLLKKSFGLIDDKAVQIDVINMRLDSSPSCCYQKEVPRITENIKAWIEKNYPELTSHFEEDLEKTCGLESPQTL